MQKQRDIIHHHDERQKLSDNETVDAVRPSGVTIYLLLPPCYRRAFSDSTGTTIEKSVSAIRIGCGVPVALLVSQPQASQAAPATATSTADVSELVQKVGVYYISSSTWLKHNVVV
jgi:hypothetical protein